MNDLPRIYETLRKIRKVKTSRGNSYEYLVNVPRQWVEAVTRELQIDLNDGFYLRILYDGKLEMKPEAALELHWKRK